MFVAMLMLLPLGLSHQSLYACNGCPNICACICSAMNLEKNLANRTSPPW